jgi:hypothetical protein
VGAHMLTVEFALEFQNLPLAISFISFGTSVQNPSRRHPTTVSTALMIATSYMYVYVYTFCVCVCVYVCVVFVCCLCVCVRVYV